MRRTSPRRRDSTSTTRRGARAASTSGRGPRTTTFRWLSATRASGIRSMRGTTTTTSSSRRTAAWSASGPLRTRRSKCLRACRCAWPTPRPRTSTATTPSSSRSPTAFRCSGLRRAISRWRIFRRCTSAIRSSTVRGVRSTPTRTSLTSTNAPTATRTAVSWPTRSVTTRTGSSTLRRRATRSTSGTFRTAFSCRRSPGTGTGSWERSTPASASTCTPTRNSN